jgi:trans-aconitate 2-methyltransferase
MSLEKAYAWNAEDYAAHSAGQFAWAMAVVDRLGLAEADTVLDIGCGDGKVTAAIAARVPAGRVLGVDRSAGMVALARRRHAGAAGGRLSFCQMDATHLGLAPVFDVVVSNAALHWVRDHAAVLAGARACLKPGGRLTFQMGGRGNAIQAIQVAQAVIARAQWSAYFRGFAFPYYFYGPDDYYPMLEQAGLEARRVALVPRDMPHPSLDSLAGWIRTAWLPYHEPVPPELRHRFIAELAAEYAARFPPDPGGVLHVQMVRLEVEAVKPAPAE